MSNNRERENPTAEEQQKKAEREQPKATPVVKTENLTLGAGDSYLLHPGANEQTERAKREYEAEKQAELDKAKASDRKPDQFRKSTSEVGVKAEKPRGESSSRDILDDLNEKNTTTTTTTNTNTKNDHNNKSHNKRE